MVVRPQHRSAAWASTRNWIRNLVWTRNLLVYRWRLTNWATLARATLAFLKMIFSPYFLLRISILLTATTLFSTSHLSPGVITKQSWLVSMLKSAPCLVNYVIYYLGHMKMKTLTDHAIGHWSKHQCIASWVYRKRHLGPLGQKGRCALQGNIRFQEVLLDTKHFPSVGHNPHCHPI